MEVITQDLISGKKVLLRYDIDVALGKGTGDRLQVTEDYKLKAGIPTLQFCLQYAQTVTILGHIGRPEGKVVDELKVEPIIEWFKTQGFVEDLGSGKLTILENLRFDPREDEADLEFAKELSLKGDVYINEAFSAYRPAASTTVLPTLLPHAAGLHFAQEVKKLTEVRNPPAGGPKKPFVAIMGGAKVTDKLPVISALAKNADCVLVGGKLVSDIRQQNIDLPKNVLVGKLNGDGFDIALETVESWRSLISGAKMIVWNGPLGKSEDPKYNQTEIIAKMILESGAEVVIGGGDSVAALNQYGLLKEAEQNAFISVGGGAMLKLLADGTLPTIEALK